MRRRAVSLAVRAALVSWTVLSCQLVGGIEEFRLTAQAEGGVDGALDGPVSDAAAVDAGREAEGPEAGRAGRSCVGLPATCGGNKDCCASAVVVGGTFNRSNDAGAQATVSTFKLDVYEVTVGRFRSFVNAGMGTQAKAPAPGDGKHPRIALSGWDASFNPGLTANTAALDLALRCFDSTKYPVWTTSPSGNETRPMPCVTWFEAFAFCAWDGGRLPTEAEWNYAAAGGSDQRDYPWGSGIDGTKASYECTGDGTAAGVCALSDILSVGSRPSGDGKWGHADLGGNVWELTLDWYALAYPTPCTDCANLTPGASRVGRGGGFDTMPSLVLSSAREKNPPSSRQPDIGFRCAADP